MFLFFLSLVVRSTQTRHLEQRENCLVSENVVGRTWQWRHSRGGNLPNNPPPHTPHHPVPLPPPSLFKAPTWRDNKLQTVATTVFTGEAGGCVQTEALLENLCAYEARNTNSPLWMAASFGGLWRKRLVLEQASLKRIPVGFWIQSHPVTPGTCHTRCSAPSTLHQNRTGTGGELKLHVHVTSAWPWWSQDVERLSDTACNNQGEQQLFLYIQYLGLVYLAQLKPNLSWSSLTNTVFLSSTVGPDYFSKFFQLCRILDCNGSAAARSGDIVTVS